MLAGKWPAGGCEYCENIERANGTSDRLFQNQIPDVYPSQLDIDATKVVVDPVVLEIFFRNTCNLKCMYCNAKFSSAIQLDDKKYNGAIDSKSSFEYTENQYQNNINKFWSWFSSNGHKLKRLNVLGGEPFLQPDTQQLIQNIELNPCPDMELNLITNLSLPPKVVQPILDKLSNLVDTRKVKRVDILASIDCWGKQAEYIRSGLDCNVFESNVKLLMSYNKFRLGILTTVNSLSIPYTYSLFEQISQWRQKQEWHWYVNFVLPADDSVFDPCVFEYDVYRKELELLLQNVPEDSWDRIQTKKLFVGVANKLEANCINNINRQTELVNYLNEYDRRRGTNWKSTFPDIYKILKDNYVV